MNTANPANYNEWLYQEYIAAKVVYKIAKKQCNQIPDDNPKKDEILNKLQKMKNRIALIDDFFLKNIDRYSDLLDSELNYSLHEDDIILLRKELKEIKKSLTNLQV